MSHNPGSIGNAVRELTPNATFRVNGDGLNLDDLEWLDNDIERPADDQIEQLANAYDERGPIQP
jgi:hypothetical protein